MGLLRGAREELPGSSGGINGVLRGTMLVIVGNFGLFGVLGEY